MHEHLNSIAVDGLIRNRRSIVYGAQHSVDYMPLGLVGLPSRFRCLILRQLGIGASGRPCGHRLDGAFALSRLVDGPPQRPAGSVGAVDANDYHSI